MKIYTKTGDQGKTSLIGGKRVPKYDQRVEAYGTIDELNSYLGLVRDLHKEKEVYDFIIWVQHKLLVTGGIFASDCENCDELIPQLHADDLMKIENEIDKLEEKMPPLKEFILPGGHEVVSHCHIARTICRRAERRCAIIVEQHPAKMMGIQFLNRLSDYLFTLSRSLSIYYKIFEIGWRQDL